MSKKKQTNSVAEWFEKGRACFHKPDGVGAVKAFEQVIDLDPAYRHADGDNPYFYLGKIHEVENRLESAIMHYSRALALDPNDEESLIGRGSCLTVTGQHLQAIEDFSKVLRFPDKVRRVARSHLLHVIAENYRQLEDWGMAIHWGQQALTANPGSQATRELLNKIPKK